MALQFQPYQDRSGEETRSRWSRTIDDIFNAYQQAKQSGLAERDRQGAALLNYGFDPRQVTPEVLARSQPGMTPQGPAAPGMPSPEQSENPLFGAVRSFLEKKRSSESMSKQGAELGLEKTRSEIKENEAQAEALGREQVYVDPDTGKQITVPRGAKLIPRLPKGKQPVNPDLNAAMELYETAKNGLMSGLSGSETGALVGRLPAITAKQQIAKGSVAAMAPVLKQLFRTAGEGVFTDRDQQLLLDMVPGRTDLPEARNAMIANIDAIVKAKIKSANRISEPEAAAPAHGIALSGDKAARLAELRAKRGR